MLNRRNIILGAGAAAVAGAGAWSLITRPDYGGLAASIRAPVPSGDGTDMRYLVHHATLAANSHNTQPWLFSSTGKGVAIQPDFSRATPAADANHHHLFASLGCAAENLSLAARAGGRSSEIGFDADGDGAVNVALGSGPAAVDPLFEAIAARQCTRSVYDGRAVSPDDLKRLEEAVRPTGGRVMLVTDKDRIGQVLDMVVAANTAQVEDPAFRAELKEWLRFGPRLAVARRDGLYSPCSGNPSMPDWLGRSIFDFVFTAQSENDRYAAQLRSSSGLAIFFTEANDAAHWVAAGRAYQRFALAATALGIRHAFVNQPVEVASARAQFAQWLGGGASPDLIVRFGHAPAMPYSLRRPLDDVIVTA